MSEESQKLVEDVVGKTISSIVDEWTRKRERHAVPEEFTFLFQAVEIGGDGLFGNEGTMMAACKRCGAVVYPSALDRHSKFHEQLELK